MCRSGHSLNPGVWGNNATSRNLKAFRDCKSVVTTSEYGPGIPCRFPLVELKAHENAVIPASQVDSIQLLTHLVCLFQDVLTSRRWSVVVPSNRNELLWFLKRIRSTTVYFGTARHISSSYLLTAWLQDQKESYSTFESTFVSFRFTCLPTDFSISIGDEVDVAAAQCFPEV